MHFGRNLRVLQRQKVDDGVLDMHGIVFGLKNEGRRSLIGDVDFGIGREVLFGESKVAGIDDHREVGTATELIGGVDGVVKALIEVGAEGGSQVSSGREAKHADAMRIDMPLGGVGADDSERALGILKRGRRLGIRPGVGHAILNQDAGNAGGVQPIAHLGAFEVDGQDVITAEILGSNGSARQRRPPRLIHGPHNIKENTQQINLQPHWRGTTFSRNPPLDQIISMGYQDRPCATVEDQLGSI